MKRAAASTPIRSFRRVTAEDGGAPGFVVHRLVQDFARRAMSDERRAQALREALEWVNAAFVGDPQDVRSWPILDPLAPHALAVARQADAGGDRGADGAAVQPAWSSVRRQGGLRRSRAADAPRARDRRDRATARIIPRWRSASTISRSASGHEPPRRGRAADAPRARDRRDRATARIIPRWRSASTISRCCFRTRTASPKPSR